MVSTAYERCGGFSTVRKIVSAFYDKVLDSETLQHYFANINMPRLIDHQTQFIASVMGGPATFSDDALHKAHARLGITQSEFDEITELLREALEDNDVDDEDVELIIDGVQKKAMFVVTKRD